MLRLVYILIGSLTCWIVFMSHSAFADGDVNVSCISPQITIAPGSTGTVNVNCTLYGNTGNNYYIDGSYYNFIAPGSVPLLNFFRLLMANRQPTVISPDNTITGIAGTSAGFTGTLNNSVLARNLQFQYSVATTSQTAPGLYSGILTAAYYQYRICSSTSCSQHVYTGTAPFILSVNVQTLPVTVSCNSPAVSTLPGGGSFTAKVLCTISGNGAKQISPSNQNIFSPSTITFSQGQSTVSATLQPTVTSPDGSISGISGTAGGGFSGTVNSLPAQVMVEYQGNTLSTTKAGTYSSNPVIFTWSTL